MNELHKRAIELWVLGKTKNEEINPSAFILESLVGTSVADKPSNTVELCRAINKIKGLPELTEDEKIEIQVYGIEFYRKNRGSASIMYTRASWMNWINWIGYVLGAVSIGIGGFSWWIIGFAIGTWAAFGMAKMAIQRRRIHGGPKWEMPVHIFMHFGSLICLMIFSIINLRN